MEYDKTAINEKKDSKRWSKGNESDTKRECIDVEQVENGYIKTVSLEIKDEKEGWIYTTKKYISKENPMEEKSLIDKLEEILK